MIITEADYKKSVLKRAEPYFHIQPEVTGYFLGKRFRIDAVITPKDRTGWLNQEISFGVEFKHFSESYEGIGDKSASLNYYAKQFKQIIDYSYTDFKSFGRIPILISPPLFNNMSGKFEQRQAQLIKNVMGQCNVGELFICNRKGLSIIFNTHHLVWCEKYGVRLGRYAKFQTNSISTK